MSALENGYRSIPEVNVFVIIVLVNVDAFVEDWDAGTAIHQVI